MTASSFDRAIEMIRGAVIGNEQDIPDTLRFANDVLSMYFLNLEYAEAEGFSEEILKRTISEAFEQTEAQGPVIRDRDEGEGAAAQKAEAGAPVHAEEFPQQYGSFNYRTRRGSVSGCADSFTALSEHPKSPELSRLLLNILVETRLIARIMNTEQLEKLVASMTPETISSGEQLITEGEYGNTMYLVEAGEFEVVKDGKRVATLKENMLFGEIAMLYSFPRTATVKCVRSATVWTTNSDAYTSILMVDRQRVRTLLSKILEKNENYARLSVECKDRIMTAVSLLHYRAGEKAEKADEAGMFMIIDEERKVLHEGRALDLRRGNLVPGGFQGTEYMSVFFFPAWTCEILGV